MAIHSSILAWRIPWTEDTVGYRTLGRKESGMTEVTDHAHSPPITYSHSIIHLSIYHRSDDIYLKLI